MLPLSFVFYPSPWLFSGSKLFQTWNKASIKKKKSLWSHWSLSAPNYLCAVKSGDERRSALALVWTAPIDLQANPTYWPCWRNMCPTVSDCPQRAIKCLQYLQPACQWEGQSLSAHTGRLGGPPEQGNPTQGWEEWGGSRQNGQWWAKQPSRRLVWWRYMPTPNPLLGPDPPAWKNVDCTNDIAGTGLSSPMTVVEGYSRLQSKGKKVPLPQEDLQQVKFPCRKHWKSHWWCCITQQAFWLDWAARRVWGSLNSVRLEGIFAIQKKNCSMLYL